MNRKVAIMAILLIFSFQLSLEANDDKISTTLSFKNDQIFPNNGKSITAQKIFAYWNKKSLGGGIDLTYKGHSNYIQGKPFLTIGSGPWHIISGFSMDNQNEHFNIGFWYASTIYKFKVFWDTRQYFSIDSQNNDYLDNFLEFTRPVGKKYFVGLNMCHYHWWETEHDWLMLGPLVGYRLSDTTSAFVRISHEWNFLDDTTAQTNAVRIGFNLKF